MAEIHEAAGGRVKIHRGFSREVEQENLPEDGRVDNVCKQWLIHEDGVVANRMQEQEFSEHYGLNRNTRRTVRQDIQVSRFVQSEEEMKAQEDRMRHLEEMKRLAEEDARVAKNIEKELKEYEVRQVHQQIQMEQEDEVLASQYQEYLLKREQDLLKKRQMDDEAVAQQMQAILKFEEQGGNTQDSEQQLTDEQLALKLQLKEQQRYERKRQEWLLQKERRKIEKALAQHTRELGVEMPGQRRSGGPDELDSSAQNTPLDRAEDNGDFSDFYVKPPADMDEEEKARLQLQQDEEIARLIQEQEHKRGAGVITPPANYAKDKLKQLEEKDAELARIMQEQEKLKSKKHRHKHRQLSVEPNQGREKHTSVPRSNSLPNPHQQTRSDEDALSNQRTERLSSVNEDERVPQNGNISFDGSSQSPHNDMGAAAPVPRSASHHSPPTSPGFNIAEALDPTFKRGHSPRSHSPPLEQAPPIPIQAQHITHYTDAQGTDITEVKRPISREIFNPLANYEDLESSDVTYPAGDGTMLPVQGQRRSPGDKKQKKSGTSGKRSSCKQQ